MLAQEVVRMLMVVQFLRGGPKTCSARLYPERGRCAESTNEDHRYLRNEVYDGPIEHTVSRHISTTLLMSACADQY
jgi:hypothetical protein